MMLRLFLVSMVAGMGMSLPSASQMEQWSQTGKSYWVAGLQHWDAMMPTGTRAFADEPKPAPIVVVSRVETPETADEPMPNMADIQFEAIVEVMASKFANELPATVIAKVETKAEPVVAEAPKAVEVAIESAPVAAAEPIVNEVVTESDSQAVPTEEVTTVVAEAPSQDLPTDVFTARDTDQDAAGDGFVAQNEQPTASIQVAPEVKVSQALRLTREAISAWATILNSDESSDALRR